MRLWAEAWRLRQAARTAITAGEFRRGLALASQAQEVQNTPDGEALCKVGGWLSRGGFA
jgi:hypothetical protein